MTGRTSSVPTATVPSAGRSGRSRQRLAVTVAAIFLILAFLVLSWIVLQRLFVSEARFDLEAALDEQASYLTGRFETHLAILDVVERVAVAEYTQSGTIDQDNLRQLVSTLLAAPGPYGLRVEVPDGTSFSYPSDLEVPSRVDSDPESPSSALVTAAHTTISDVVTLPDDCAGILYTRTALLDDEQTMTITLVADMTDALSVSGLPQQADQYVLAGLDSHGHAFLGDAAMLPVDPVESELFVAGAQWRLVGAPSGGLDPGHLVGYAALVRGTSRRCDHRCVPSGLRHVESAPTGDRSHGTRGREPDEERVSGADESRTAYTTEFGDRLQPHRAAGDGGTHQRRTASAAHNGRALRAAVALASQSVARPV